MLELVPASMINIAPEQTAATTQALQGVAIVVRGDARWIAHYVPANNEIHISFRVLELFWCAAYAYVVLFDGVYAARDPNDRKPADLTQPPEVADAMKLLKWALQDWLDDGGAPLPANLLPSRLPRRLGTRASVADELCLIAVGFILHHELAHHRLQHSADEGTDTLDQEKQADAAAAEWILDGVPLESLFMTKRAAGASIAMLAMTARSVHSGEAGGRKHPRHFDRLFNLLDRHLADLPDHSAWIFATVALKLHLDNSKITVPTDEYDSFRDCLNSYIDILEEATRPDSATQ